MTYKHSHESGKQINRASRSLHWCFMSAEYQTKRLLLRPWLEDDKPVFATMNSDPRVMEFFPATRTPEQSDWMADECNRRLVRDGFTFWAVERKDLSCFIGFVGLNSYEADLDFCPCVEIGWRIAFERWGNGFATEAATKCLSLAFNEFDLDEVVAFTTLANIRSWRVMEKIGMLDTGENFTHPSFPADSVLREHCLYRSSRQHWTTWPRSDELLS